MLFNSLEFAIFLPIVFILYFYFTSHNLRLQNFLIIVASYVFYGWWDYRFLSLIIFSTIIDYSIGILLSKELYVTKRKILLWASISINLGFLGIFKYYNFFIDSLYNLAPGLQSTLGFNTLEVILPVGISFYTFQTLSYTIDVYRGNLKPTKDLISFAAFVGFFPQLVAGPIERASNLLPQFYKPRKFTYAKAANGLRQILWGFFKKIVIADNCAHFANLFFSNNEDYGGSTLLLGAIFFTFQIYGDFSGYSDIAIGTSRLFGFNLMKNFAFPYFSRDIAEFWRRWHISLSTWFRDYLYIPLGGSKGGIHMKIRNTFIIFIVSGFWHGANWTFIVWGALNAIYFLPLLLTKRNRKNTDLVAEGKTLPNLKEIMAMGGTFILTVFAWIFFRAKSIEHAIDYFSGIFAPSIFNIPQFDGKTEALTLGIIIILFMIIEWFGRSREFAIEYIGDNLKRPLRFTFYFLIIMSILFLGNFSDNQFIYFQF
ncbi:MBOAT family O-acyltransferase [Christiangramia aquimixticola]|uniref:MBOAT family O-acyltransferase n=1 Tax=Christiangramia aquimixticola TaxID=1697558 RepID=UPI003AA8FE20